MEHDYQNLKALSILVADNEPGQIRESPHEMQTGKRTRRTAYIDELEVTYELGFRFQGHGEKLTRAR
jgi:hypothetical protein